VFLNFAGLESPIVSIFDENVKKVEKMVMTDRQITIREFSVEVGTLIGSYHNIFFQMFWA
jgi:hypothetical protein